MGRILYLIFIRNNFNLGIYFVSSLLNLKNCLAPSHLDYFLFG